MSKAPDCKMHRNELQARKTITPGEPGVIVFFNNTYLHQCALAPAAPMPVSERICCAS